MEYDSEVATQENSRLEYKEKVGKITQELKDLATGLCAGGDSEGYLTDDSTYDLYRIANKIDDIFKED